MMIRQALIVAAMMSACASVGWAEVRGGQPVKSGKTYYVAEPAKPAAPKGDMQATIDELKKRLAEDLNIHNGDMRIQVDNVAVAGEARREKGTYLGMNASPTDAAMRAQLKLPRGVGLTVDFVQKDSPAAAAGLELHDVVTKIDEQYLVNLQQLQVLIRMHKAGDVIKLTVIHGGETKTIDAKLAEGMVPAMDEAQQLAGVRIPLPGPGGNVLGPRVDANGGVWQPAGQVTMKSENGITTKTMSDAEQTLVLQIDKDGKKTLSVEDVKKKDVLFSGPVDTEDDKKKLPAGVADKLKQLEASRGTNRLIGNVGNVGNAGGGRVVINQGGLTVRNGTATISRADGEHTLTLTVGNDGSRTLVAKDRDGKVIFDGPVNTEEEKKKLPEEVAKKLEGMKVNRGN